MEMQASQTVSLLSDPSVKVRGKKLERYGKSDIGGSFLSRGAYVGGTPASHTWGGIKMKETLLPTVNVVPPPA